MVLAVQARKTYAIFNYLVVNVDHQMPFVGVGFSSREGYTYSFDVPETGFTGFELVQGNTGAYPWLVENKKHNLFSLQILKADK